MYEMFLFAERMCVCDVGTGGVLEDNETIIKHASGYIFVHDIS